MQRKNVLFISDNKNICRNILHFIQDHDGNSELQVHFGTSPFSSKSEFTDFLGVDIFIYDLRHSRDVQKILQTYDLVISVHCKQLFPPELVKGIRCINIHPGYNPINRGWYPQVFAIINDTEVGATIHEIDDKIDHGGIIARKLVEKRADDTSLSLYDRIVEAEMDLFKNNFSAIIDGSYSTISPENEGRLYLKKDFNNLLKIDLEAKVTFGEAIDRLRALSHGSYSNAYFLDPVSGEKIYLSISLKRETVQDRR
ncbi:hypothetical protein AAU57_12575 [Nonlabens sp. YIK11]|uniref:dTDP-4-amino-4,6-dideoxyglucose formyltransferase n=1 Tax=Nonlabens sp. YIK11 TaxID=1453349 RepID=UPI000707D878|nr:dTDP-4-amino-4,6-dideoxyglucose formyltransferase [Nonlabens sp. YIK11]KQC34072.1 hypothetical protein AAU57_12575 [Nonlabens sp. YIK11]